MRTHRKPTASAVRADSFYNALAKLGGNYDRRAGTRFVAGKLLDHETLDNLYHFNDLAAVVCDTYPVEAMRQGFEFTVPDDLDLAAKVNNRTSELCIKSLVTEAAIWGRVFGDACIFLGVDDGQSVDQPLDYARIRSIKYLSVYDRRDFTIESYYNNPILPKFNTPEYYTMVRINPIRGVLAPEAANVMSTGLRIHESRLVWFHGTLTSRRKLSENAGWHHSVLQRPYDVLRDFEMTWAGAAHIMQEASVGVYKIKGLMEILTSESGAEALQRRFEAIDMGRSVARSQVVDLEEDYTRVATTFTGVPDMLDRFAGRFAASAKIPVTRLMGEAPAGLNATGEGDTRAFYDNVAGWRTSDIQPGLDRILRCVLYEMSPGMTPKEILPGPAGAETEGTEPEWEIKWPSLYQPTDKEKADTRKTVADTDVAYINAGVLDPTEVTLSRFGEGGWSMETTVDLELRQKMADDLDEDDIKPPAPEPVDGPGGGAEGGPNDPKGAKVAKKGMAPGKGAPPKS